MDFWRGMRSKSVSSGFPYPKGSGAPLRSCPGSREWVDAFYGSNSTGFGDICNAVWLAKQKAEIPLASYRGRPHKSLLPTVCRSGISSELLPQTLLAISYFPFLVQKLLIATKKQRSSFPQRILMCFLS